MNKLKEAVLREVTSNMNNLKESTNLILTKATQELHSLSEQVSKAEKNWAQISQDHE